MSKDRDFVEALARGLEVIRSFSTSHLSRSVSEVAVETGLARPTVRRILLTLEQLGYVRAADGMYSLAPKVLELGTAYIGAQGMWDIARPHMVELVGHTHESCSVSQLDGSDIVYTARVPVPKIIGLSVQIGTRFPAAATSMGQVLLADLGAAELDRVLRLPSASNVIPRVKLSRRELDKVLADVRRRGWALSDEQLTLGIRSIAAPIRSSSGRVIAAVNVTVHAAETSITTLKSQHLPRLLETAEAITADLQRIGELPSTQPID